MERHTIGKLAQKAGVNLETIRYYERRGLLPSPPRNKSGHRQYSDKDVKRTIFIKQTQALGFSLQEIGELLSLKTEAGKTCHDVKQKVRIKLTDVEQKIRSLQRIRQILVKMESSCPGEGSLDGCPILESLKQ